ncbi:hypothetical protein [Alteromonas sp. C1M14]|uniref:hypothetical protein n=1 Tax=Alteromonas sp. C1M14 TaxID=2841567 RepID=UPI001C09C8D7|nr:hypothetical protein [Alteromonas sp. C1M14]MBU2978562.1 hypothetical protein [Alteromonas sp. C1M14]
MRSYITFFTVSVLLLLTGCTNDHVVFNPDIGEHRLYNRIQAVELSSPEINSQDFHVNSYAEYKVNDLQDDRLTLHIEPHRLDMSIDSQKFSTAEAEGLPPALLTQMSAGVDMIINSETGALIDVNSQQQSLKDNLQKVLGGSLGSMMDQISQPNLTVSLSPEKGWQTSGDFKGIPEVTFTVTKVTDSDIWVSFEGKSGSDQVAGLAQVERASGWIVNQVVTTNIEKTIQGKAIVLRSTEVINKVDDGHIAYLPVMRSQWSNRWTEITDSTPTTKIAPISDASKVFSQRDGIVEIDDGELSLELTHAVNKDGSLGKVVISEPQIFDISGQLITSPSQLSETYSYNNYKETGKISTTQIRFTGPGDLSDITDTVGSVKTQVAWYPDASFLVDVPLNDDHTGHFSDKGITIDITPTEDSNVYALTFKGQAKDRLFFNLSKQQSIEVQFRAYPEAPQWLTAEESNMRYQASPYEEAYRVLMRGDEFPSSLSFVLERAVDKPVATQQITFYTDDAKRFNPNIEPQTSYLFEHNPPDTNLESMTSTRVKHGQLKLTLGQSQIDFCSATLSPKAEEAGSPLIFAAGEDKNSFDHPRALLLQTEDGVRQYFYGLGERKVSLSCAKTRAWKTTSFPFNESTPWVVPMDALSHDENFNTVGDIFAVYRFLDAKGKALSLMPLDKEEVVSPSTPVKAVLFPNNTLRIAGVPKTVQTAVIIDQPIDHEFNVTFSDLPTGGE